MIEPKRTLLDLVIKRATDYALSIQHQEGYWIAPLDSNSTMEAEFLLLLYFLGVHDEQRQQKIVNHILKNQQDDGSWPLYFQGPGDLSTTVECYFALMLSGVSKDAPNMVLAREFIIAKGGISKVRVFTQIWLALFGQWSWQQIPTLIPEIIFLPSWFPFNIYSFASWARATVVPLTIVMAERPVCSIPAHCALTDLFLQDAHFQKTQGKGAWGVIFKVIEKGFKLYNRMPWKPGRGLAVKKSIQWIVEHQEADGSWGGIQPPWVYSLIALKLTGHSLDHPVMQKGIAGFDSFSIEDNETMQVQACVSPVWDTSLMVNALKEVGVESSHPQVQSACRWLMKKQILVGGDWSINNPKLAPGGWAFEFENANYPDIDDTAEVLMALWHASLSESENVQCKMAIKAGTQWLLGMQDKNGGWAAFDRENNNFFLAKFPFFDFGEILDPPSVDVTAHVLEALGMMGYTRENPIVRKALDYIYQEQEANGSWFGRWGVNYIYGIGTVLPALRAVGEDINNPAIQQAIQWLIAHQNSDGGWGESCASYVDVTQHGRGPSTPSQTAWALLALMAVEQYKHPAVQEGIDYLCDTMNSQGTWDEEYYTGCGFPGYGEGQRKSISSLQQEKKEAIASAAFMINYNLYRHCWPLMALGRYQKSCFGTI